MPHIDQMKVWSIICGHAVVPDQKIVNPLRPDTNPGCWISRRGRDYRLFDYADNKFFSMRIIDAIMYKYNLNLIGALNKMIQLNQGEYNYIEIQYDQYDLKTGFEFKLDYKPRSFVVRDRDYWMLRGISKANLVEDEIEAVKVYRCNSKRSPDEYYYFYPTKGYAIKFNSGNIKILMPGNDKRFITNCTQEDLGGKYSLDSDQLVVSKSYKDYRQLKNLGYNTLWTMNEGCQPKSLIEVAKQFKDVVIFYDNDKAGIEASSKLNKMIPNSREVMIPLDLGCKDPDELKIMYWDIDEIIQNIINI